MLLNAAPSSRQPNPADHGEDAGAAARRGLSTLQERDQSRGDERGHHREARDRAEPASLIENGADRSAGREAGKHGCPHPGDHLAGIVGADAGEAPDRRPCDDETLRRAKHRASGEQERDGDERRPGKAQRDEIKEPRRRRPREACQNRELGAAPICISAGPQARDKGRRKLRTGNQPDRECAEAEALMHMQRQHWKRRADDKERAEDGPHQR